MKDVINDYLLPAEKEIFDNLSKMDNLRKTREEIKIKDCGLSFEKIECQLEPDYSKMYFEFQFKDGKKARYRMDKDCHNLQQFLDRMNKFHELEKENKLLQEQLNEANEVIKKYVDLGNWNDYYNEHLGNVADDMQKYLEKWGVK